MSIRKFCTLIFAVSIIFVGLSLADDLPSRYHTYQQVLDSFSVLRDNHTEILKLDTLGYSQRDSVPLIRLKISDNAELDEDEPAIFLCAEVHSEEVLGPEVLLNFTGDIIARYLQEDPITLKYMRLLEIFVVPFLNPEGHLVVEGGNLDWRKNKSDNDSDNVFDFHDGVDNNRNYDIGWSFDTTLGGMTPESLMYKGCAPFSESENRAMAAFAQKYKPVAALDYHSPTYGTGQIAYFPWNFQGGHGASPDYTMMNHICELFAGQIAETL